ncbi:Tlg2p [Sugiyamaella lignohabitans]|uniref:Tlg2p n=1 Tax=Sugiyamaella lignohabitans TaxID=796027 RepID=A0A167G048_9ASCO|nr:Tlg2p [Sugiyamaella lignohabitans]ANB15928.1 Tlg2p [Sugiyamaella lignohabitans]
MFRDRTNLYISYRQSYAHHPIPSTSIRDVPEEQQGLIGGAAAPGTSNGYDMIGIEMDLLPPSWVDVSSEVDERLSDIKRQISQLDTLHRKNALPGFDDRTYEEEQIEKLTFEITSGLHECQSLIKKFDAMSNSGGSTAEVKMSSNMKISMATKVQATSSTFRKMQSNYLKALRKDSGISSYTPLRPQSPAIGSSSSGGASGSGNGSYDPVAEDEMDVAFSENTLRQQEQKQSLIATEDTEIRQREQEITKIAQGILELADIFKDLQTMVIDQGTLLDRIDYNVETMYTNVKQADKELIQATHYQKRTQKCKVILLLCLIIVGLIIVLVVKPKRHSQPAPAPAPAPAPVPAPVPPPVQPPDTEKI